MISVSLLARRICGLLDPCSFEDRLRQDFRAYTCRDRLAERAPKKGHEKGPIVGLFFAFIRPLLCLNVTQICLALVPSVWTWIYLLCIEMDAKSGLGNMPYLCSSVSLKIPEDSALNT